MLGRRTHQLSDGVGQDFVPVTDDALGVVLDQEVHSALTFQLEERKEEFRASPRPPEVSVRCLWPPPTSNTFFLLDLSLEAQPNVAPRRSTVNSGTI